MSSTNPATGDSTGTDGSAMGSGGNPSPAGSQRGDWSEEDWRLWNEGLWYGTEEFYDPAGAAPSEDQEPRGDEANRWRPQADPWQHGWDPWWRTWQWFKQLGSRTIGFGTASTEGKDSRQVEPSEAHTDPTGPTPGGQGDGLRREPAERADGEADQGHGGAPDSDEDRAPGTSSGEGELSPQRSGVRTIEKKRKYWKRVKELAALKKKMRVAYKTDDVKNQDTTSPRSSTLDFNPDDEAMVFPLGAGSYEQDTEVETELGYAIKRTRLIGLMVGTLGCLGLLALLGVWSQFEIHLEKRTMRRELRREEHHAASKLAQVGMELWSEYRDDIHESHEAQMLMKLLNSSYTNFEAQVKATVDRNAKELGLNSDKAGPLTGLVDHLVEAGKRAVPLEKRAEKEAASTRQPWMVFDEVRAEEKLIEEDVGTSGRR
eukprot:Skav222841  [mRNA]  locus=scaffold1263:74954:91126:- [translate_table: standard]